MTGDSAFGPAALRAIGVAMLAGTAVVGAQRSAIPPSDPVPSGLHFSGLVTIAGHPADAGTTVQVEVIRSATNDIACGEASTFYAPRGPGQSMYDLTVNAKAECTNPDTTYQFFVNGVYATSQRYAFSRLSSRTEANLAVTEVALETKGTTGLKLAWFYGTVKDKFGRPAPKGTVVKASAKNGACTGTGTTKDLSWQPKTPNTEKFGRVGFYWLSIPMTPACVDVQGLVFDVSVENGTSEKSAVNIGTPPYGKAYSANLILVK